MRSVDTSSGVAAVPTVAERFQRLLEILRRRWPILVSVPVVVAVVAAFVAGTGTERYDATAKVLLSNTPIIGSTDPDGTPAPADPERDLNTKIGLFRLESVAREVRQRLALPMSGEALVDKVTATPEGTTDIVAVTASDASATRAAAIANAFAEEYVAFRERVARSTLRKALAGIEALMASLSAEERASERGRALESRMRDLEVQSAIQTGGAQVVLEAAPPTSPAAPRPVISAVLGAIIGLMLALVIITVLELTRRRVGEQDQLIHFDESELEALFRGGR
jgi:polysaccharide biosynthesis transport protein